MSYYTLQIPDLTCYGDYYPPSLLREPIILAQCFDQVQSESYCNHVKIGNSFSSGVHDVNQGEKIDYDHRSSSFVSVDQSIYREVEERLVFTANFHVQPQIGRRLKLAEPIQFLKYDSSNSGHFSKHTDDGYFSNGVFQYVAPYRKFTTITYLNDDYTGGELVLENLRDPTGNCFYQKMPTGTMIIFPADQRYPHEVRPVLSGVRYSIVAWFNFE